MSKFIEFIEENGKKLAINRETIVAFGHGESEKGEKGIGINTKDGTGWFVTESYEQVKHLIETGEPLDNGDIAENKTIDTKQALEWLGQFKPSQIEQIMLGLEEGVDVNLYAKKEFDYLQMEQIRLGQQSGVDVTLYVNAGFNWMQMRQILLGLQNGIDASLYAKQELKDYEMCLARKKLEEKKGEVE